MNQKPVRREAQESPGFGRGEDVNIPAHWSARPVTQLDTRRDPAPGFGEMLERYRLAAGLSQTQLAVKAGLDYTTVSRIRSGERTPSLAALARLATALELDDRDRAALALAALEASA